MKTITRNYLLKNITLVFLLLGCFNALSQTVIHSATFESGTDGWTLGTNAVRTNDASWAPELSYSMRIRSNNGVFSSPLFSLAAYDKVDVSFQLTNRGYNAGQTFNLEYRPDGSSAWQVVGVMTAGNIPSKNADFQNGFVYTRHAKTITVKKTDPGITFPASATAQFRFTSNSANTSQSVHIDLVTITGTTFNSSITEGPGGADLTSLELWLRADKADGSGVLANNANVTDWFDTGKGHHAKTIIPTQAPSYKNNTTDNINFNPVVQFSNSSATSSSDMTYLTVKDELSATSGFYSNDVFMVLIPDEPITTGMIPLDTFTSTDPTGNTYNEDVTGFGYGNYTARFDDEFFAWCIGTTGGVDNGYGRGDKTGAVDLNQISIINARHNDIATPNSQDLFLNNIEIGDSESDAPDFSEIRNQRYWLGRSQYWNGSFGGRMAEVITYSATNTDDDRDKILSYLAVKYGITLGDNGVSQDYTAANGTVIWDQADADSAGTFNFDIAGIGRSDVGGLMQRQSKSVNPNTLITMGLEDIAATNDANPNDFANDENYLLWSNDSQPLAAATPPIEVDMSDNISGLTSMVDFISISRTWRVQETGDIGNVKISLPEVALSATITPPGSFLMFISNTPAFNPSSEYRIMTVNGSELETTYDFPANAVRYITFGYAPQYEYIRSVDFDGAQDYMDADDTVDLTDAFTMSAWIMSDAGNTDADIISKRDIGPFTEGYAMQLGGSSQVQGNWKNSSGANQLVTGATPIPANEWHYVTVVYDGTNGYVYVDGVLDSAPTPLDPPVDTSQHLLIAASDYTNPTRFFDGNIDEVRIFDVALSADQIRYIMNQELEEFLGDNSVNGSVIPQSIELNVAADIPWDNLEAYYPMTLYTFTNINDQSNNNGVAAIKNLETVDFQTAPLPYESIAGGDWTTVGTWEYNSVQQLPHGASIVDGTPIEWNIVNINHDIYTSANTTVLGAMIDSSAELVMNNDNKLDITHYFKLDGFLDLQGEAQLVQQQGSEIDIFSTGYMERDQAGTADTYTYNYWSSPVGRRWGGDLNRAYKVNNRFKDGSDPTDPLDINWTWGFDGAPASGGGPITLSAKWIFKFENSPIGDYDSWSFIGPFDYFKVGEGFTLKGPGNGLITDFQNYTFTGKPNNDQLLHEITLPINAGRNYLVGNPFPSALDGLDFIADNPHLDGTLYFWEHWGGGSHVLSEYQGGYATYNLSGGNPAMSHPMVSDAGGGTKTPGRYVPVGQGFFVAADSAGDIEFNNSQRNFVKSGATSIFMFADNTYSSAPMEGETDDQELDDSQFDTPDTRTKLRVGFDSPKGLHRQLLVTFDDNTTMGIDRGYEARVLDDQIEDMNWLIGEDKYVVQGIPTITGQGSKRLPLFVKVEESGKIEIGLDAAEHVGEKLIPYLHDKSTNQFVNLLETSFTTTLEAGAYPERFQIVLRRSKRQSTAVNTAGTKTTVAIGAMHQKVAELVTVFSKNNEEEIESVVVYNTLGQLIGQFNYSGTNVQEVFTSNGMAGGTYILQTTTKSGVYTTKILIEK